MGQKVQPNGFRLGVIRDWDAKWFAAGSNYAQNLIEDQKVRKHLRQRLTNAAISKVELVRAGDGLNVTIHTARPGIVIGKKGEDIERLRQSVGAITGSPVQIAVEEVRKPELDATLVAENICQQLEKRIMFRRAMKRAVQNAMRLGAKGVKVMVAGRLNGAEIARTEWYREGRVPLHTLRADVDYGFAEANTTYGVIGVKVWVFKGEIFGEEPAPEAARDAGAGAA